MLTPFILFAKRLRGHEIGVDKRHFISVFHRKINILSMTERDFVVIGILQRHLVAAEMRKHIIAAIFPGAGCVENIGELIHQHRFPARLAAQNRHRAYKERLHFGRDVLPVAERISADLRAADIHKGAFRVDNHGLDAEMFAVLRRVGLLGGIDGIRLDPLLLHKRFNAFAPDVPAVRIRLHALFIKGVNADVFLVFKRL